MEGRCVCMLTSCCAGRMWVGESIYERVDVYDRRVILSEGAYILWEGGGYTIGIRGGYTMEGRCMHAYVMLCRKGVGRREYL